MVAARRTAVLLAALAALAVAGLAAAAPIQPNLELNETDMAWAESMLLTPDDVGKGWSTDPTASSSSSSDDEASATCSASPDESDLTVTGVGSSAAFRRPDQSFVASGSIVWKTREDAAADWDRGTALVSNLLSCLAQDFTSASTKRLRIGILAAGPLEFPGAAPRTAAFRLKLLFTRTVRVRKKLKRVSTVANTDLIYLGNGRAFAVLATFWFSKKPLTQAYEAGLAAKIADRMAQDPSATASP